jgi:SNF2 family DNA or RNA helicase
MPSEPLNDKEQRVFKKLEHVPGLILAHGVGTGKSKTSIQVADKLNRENDVVVPAALQENYHKELKKWLGDDTSHFHVESQQTAANKGLQYDTPGGTMIVDEAHRARDPKSKLLKHLKNNLAAKKLLLTATPVYNHPADIAPLINVAAGRNVLPEDKNEFSNKFIDQKPVNPGFFAKFMGIHPGTEDIIKDKNPELINALKNYVDYEPGNQAGARAAGFPASREETVNVPLSESQQDIYKAIMGQAPFWLR